MMNPILCYSKQYTNQGIQASPRPGNFFQDFGVFFREQLNDDLLGDEAFRLPPAEFERLYEEMLRQPARDPETG